MLDIGKLLAGFGDFLKDKPGETVLLAFLSAVGGAILKFAFDEWSAKNKGRRDMMTMVTTRVNDLAKAYYWHLANHSSVLGNIFQKYLSDRQALELWQYDPATLRQERDKLIDAAVERSFLHYALLTRLTYDFNFKAGSTFLLKDYWAGRSIQSLQNELRLVLGMNQDLLKRFDTFDKDGKPVEVTPSQLMGADYDEARKQYRQILLDEDKLRRATKYLKACGDLFDYELKKLYRDWFKNPFGGVPKDPPGVWLAISDAVPAETRLTIQDLAAKSQRAGYVVAPLSSSSSKLSANASKPPPADSSPKETGKAKSENPSPAATPGNASQTGEWETPNQ